VLIPEQGADQEEAQELATKAHIVDPPAALATEGKPRFMQNSLYMLFYYT
jgi:hypothetical protein